MYSVPLDNVWCCKFKVAFNAVQSFSSVFICLVVREGPGHLVCVVTELVSETDRQTGRIIQAMRQHRKLDALTTAVSDALRYQHLSNCIR